MFYVHEVNKLVNLCQEVKVTENALLGNNTELCVNCVKNCKKKII